MKKFYELEKNRRLEIFNQVSNQSGLPSAAIEKDWWVTLVLKVIFLLPMSKYIVFKGGTSLSKGWKLIERFSEDIDLAVDPAFFGFSDDLSKGQIRKLRKDSCKFFNTEFPSLLKKRINGMDISGFNLKVSEFESSDTDPMEIQLHYDSLTEKADYLKPQVQIEIGSRSLMEPTKLCPVQSIVGETLTEQNFIDNPAEISIVLPKKTFLEKAFLLHEEFQRPSEKINLGRKSRHLYDLEKMMDTVHGKAALEDNKLYNSIIQHRLRFAHLQGVDYSTHSPDRIDFIPPGKYINELKADYKTMQENMIYGDSLAFDKLIERLTELQDRFRKIPH
jgi:hypothetical protein